MWLNFQDLFIITCGIDGRGIIEYYYVKKQKLVNIIIPDVVTPLKIITKPNSFKQSPVAERTGTPDRMIACCMSRHHGFESI